MSSEDEAERPSNIELRNDPTGLRGSMECELFESLVHQLIEKGVLTRNDALSVVQTVAQVRGGMEEDERRADEPANDLAVLKQLYASFELISERPVASRDFGNVLPLRPPVHGDSPEFPRDD